MHLAKSNCYTAIFYKPLQFAHEYCLLFLSTISLSEVPPPVSDCFICMHCVSPHNLVLTKQHLQILLIICKYECGLVKRVLYSFLYRFSFPSLVNASHKCESEHILAFTALCCVYSTLHNVLFFFLC